jgi:hypothetical protein
LEQTKEVAMSSAHFSINCPECGDLELAAEQLWLVLPSLGEAHYDFICPTCDEHVRHVAGEAAIAFLAALIAVEEIDVPAEAIEPKSGPPLTVDDVLDFSLELESGDWAAELLGDVRPAV